MITALLQHEIREENMGEISFSNHISNEKSAINSKAKLAGVAKHNLRKYRSQDYSRDNITLLYETANLMQDVKKMYTAKNLIPSCMNTMESRQDRKDGLVIILNMCPKWNRIWRWKSLYNAGIKNLGSRTAVTGYLWNRSISSSF